MGVSSGLLTFGGVGGVELCGSGEDDLGEELARLWEGSDTSFGRRDESWRGVPELGFGPVLAGRSEFGFALLVAAPSARRPRDEDGFFAAFGFRSLELCRELGLRLGFVGRLSSVGFVRRRRSFSSRCFFAAATAFSVGGSLSGIRELMCSSISYRLMMSSLVTSDIALPTAPVLPVLPIRWT